MEKIEFDKYVHVPSRSYIVTLGDNDHDLFVKHLASFAKVDGLQLKKSQVTPDPRDLSITLTRKDIMMWASNPFNPDEFYVDFYKSNADPIADTTFDALVEDMKKYLSGMPMVPRQEN